MSSGLNRRKMDARLEEHGSVSRALRRNQVGVGMTRARLVAVRMGKPEQIRDFFRSRTDI